MNGSVLIMISNCFLGPGNGPPARVGMGRGLGLRFWFGTNSQFLQEDSIPGARAF